MSYLYREPGTDAQLLCEEVRRWLPLFVEAPLPMPVAIWDAPQLFDVIALTGNGVLRAAGLKGE